MGLTKFPATVSLRAMENPIPPAIVANRNLPWIIGLLAALCLTGCGVTAVNIPGIGYINFDPPALSDGDKTLQYLALVDAAQQRRVGASVVWKNDDSGHWGKYTVTRLNPRLPMRGEPGYRRFVCDPRYRGGPVHSVEATEEIYSDGREFITRGLGFYRAVNGRWYRYQ